MTKQLTCASGLLLLIYFLLNPVDHKRDLQRATKESGERIASAGALIGGPFSPTTTPTFQIDRASMFDALWEENEKKLASKESLPISITLPNGDIKSGFAFKTSPMDIAKGISQGLADAVCIARVSYTSRFEEDTVVACDEDEEAMQSKEPSNSVVVGELWDLNRPLIGDCTLSLLKYEDPDAKTVFLHSSAHILGAALEATFGSYLTIGPALQHGFYYDSYMGQTTVSEEDLKKIDEKAGDITKKKFPFQRLVLSKEQALQMFQSNPFKVSLISNKIPKGGKTTVYKCGPLVDLCMGPHLPHTGRVKAFAATRSSSTNWLGQVGYRRWWYSNVIYFCFCCCCCEGGGSVCYSLGVSLVEDACTACCMCIRRYRIDSRCCIIYW
jgi:threonyl-tRNA synthetase